MTLNALVVLLLIGLLPAVSVPRPAATPTPLLPALESYLDAREAEFDRISDDRQAVLQPLATWIAEARAAGRPIDLVFVCTHNSRRSHMAQLWAKAAAAREGIELTTWSGGTEATAFNPRAVAAMSRAGFEITRTTGNANPIYHVRLGNDLPTQTCFSKPYSAAPNPTAGIAAVMVCGDADRRCPIVPGASARVAIPFVDPKVSDGTPEEAATYDERSAQIAREMLWVMTQASRGR
ncbi:MAG: Protein ArsC [Planctomycetota bacterium]|jgi:arsenate reductase